LDTSFGTGGAIAISSAYFSSLSALSVMADGSFFVINHGYSPLDNSEPFALYLTCFNSDGSVNTSFGNAGTVYFEGIFYSDVDPQIIVQPDGKILVSSFQQNLDGLPGMSLMRLNSDGSLDTNFESTMLSVDVGAYPHAIFLEPDGKIIMAGQRAEVNETYLFYNFLTVRYLADGSVDTNYGNNGITKTFLGDQIGALNTVVKSIVRQDDGKFLVGLTRNEQYPANPPLEIYDFVLYRFTADGEYDTSFGFAGKVTLSFFDQYDELYAVVLQSDHKIVLAGTTDNGATRDFALARLQNCIDVASEVNVTVCAGASYSLDNETYTASGDYQAVLTSASGCDSLVTLHLTVLPAASYAQSISLCAGESVTINGETYTNSGVYQTLVTTANGCDSTITTSLFVDNLQAQIMSNNQNLAAIDYPENALFQWLDCDNMENPIPGATDAVFEPAVTGSYAVQVSNASCSATSVCEDFTVVGVPTIGDQADFDFGVFPNPVQNDFLLGVSGCVWPCSFALLDAQGREMLNEIILQKEVRISLDVLASGVYLLKVVDALGNERTKRIVKE
jgi:uncharacterized delta-60 repeat protein